MDALFDMSAVIQTAQQAAEPKGLDRGSLVALLDGDGGLRVHDLEKYADRPASARGSLTTYRVPSFVEYFFAHCSATSQVFVDANPESPAIVGVLNPHDPRGNPGWHDHVIHLNFRKTPQFAAWSRLNGELVDQATFAEFIELNLKDIMPPPQGKSGPQPADMLVLAQDLEAKREVKMRFAERLADGNRKFVVDEETKATVGGNPNLTVPSQFFVGIPLYECTPAGTDGKAQRYELLAQFRYRPTPQGLKLGFVFERLSDVIALAIDDVVREIGKHENATGKIVYGKPITGLR